MGSIFPHHGVDRLIAAFSLVLKEHPEARLCVVGDGYLRKEFEAMAAKTLPAGTFVFTGKLPHKRAMEYVNAFDCCIMPDSNWYGSPVKILEYGWLKKPVVAPDLIPIRDLMDNEADGYLVKPGVDALAGGMKEVIRDPGMGRKRGEHFHEKIKAEFTWKKLTEKILRDDSWSISSH